MNAEATDREVIFGRFRAVFCDCSRMNGDVHLIIWYDSARLGSFCEALPAIILLLELAVAGKLDKYKAMGLGLIALERLPLFNQPISAAEAEARAIKAHPSMKCIAEKIFAGLKAEEHNYARDDFPAFFEKEVEDTLAQVAS